LPCSTFGAQEFSKENRPQAFRAVKKARKFTMATAEIFEYTLWYHPISMALVFKARKESQNPVLQPLKPFFNG